MTSFLITPSLAYPHNPLENRTSLIFKIYSRYGISHHHSASRHHFLARQLQELPKSSPWFHFISIQFIVYSAARVILKHNWFHILPWSKSSKSSPSHSEHKPKYKMANETPYKLPPLPLLPFLHLLSSLLTLFQQHRLTTPSVTILFQDHCTCYSICLKHYCSVNFITPSILLFRSSLRQAFLIIFSKIASFPHSTHYHLASYHHYLTLFYFFMAFAIT